MKNGIFKIKIDELSSFIEKNEEENLIVHIDSKKIHDDKSFIMCVGLSWGIAESKLEEIENINWFNDVLCDFIYDRYEDTYESFTMVLDNWSKLILDESFEIGGYLNNYRQKEDYIEVFNEIIDQFSKYDEDYPEDHLMDFTVLLVG
ncbi:hypothetical protein [Lactococcus lactis]|uniref:hypothetical protein n=1 Tax=Lactococcus lactis TaxID=1358 RepID=UPI00111CA272|nr:hypothetical protein [Lactococcus lactis]TNU81135.1 hypothetical protein FIB48_02105 [Lactococcus lactis subsp. lactis]